MNKLKDKVAVVTGSSKGIGAAIAKALAAEGASVVVNYASSRAGADEVVAAIQRNGGRAIAVQARVGSAADVEHLFEKTKKAFGKLDILVNNAGVYEFSPIDQVSEELYRKLFDTNVLGVLLASREAVKHFGEAGGTIINVGSAVTEITPPASSVYTGTKGAVDAITRVLSRELGPRKIRVNSINPGMVETEGTHAAGFLESDFRVQAEQQTPLGRIARTADIAPLAVFLASPDSGWLTGELMVASGGMR